METVTGRDGKQKTLKMPFVDLGLLHRLWPCETRCPVLIAPGVRVSAANESRPRAAASRSRVGRSRRRRSTISAPVLPPKAEGPR